MLNTTGIRHDEAMSAFYVQGILPNFRSFRCVVYAGGDLQACDAFYAQLPPGAWDGLHITRVAPCHAR